MDNCFLIKDSYEMSHVVVEECTADTLAVTTVFTCEETGNTECMRGYVDRCDMDEYMSTVPKGITVKEYM